jgi:hypothetical protein
MERRELLLSGAIGAATAILLPFFQASSAHAQTGWSQVREIGNTLSARTRLGLTQSDIYQVDIRKLIGTLAMPNSTNASVVDLIENYYVIDSTESSTYVRFEDPNLVYRSTIERTAQLRAAIPLIELTLGNEQRSVVTVKQNGVVFTDKPPSMRIADALVPDNFPGADNLRWIQGVSLWSVTIDLFQRSGGSGALRWFLELGGERYRKLDETQAFPLMTVNAPKVWPFGRQQARALVAETPALADQPITALDAPLEARGFTRSAGSAPPAMASVPSAVLNRIRAPAIPAPPVD